MEDPFAVLGLPQGATLGEIEAARRALAKSAHPDVGGSLERMQRINAAADAAIRLRAVHEPPGTVSVDRPSFTVEALPAETFEALLIVATWLGEVIDDDPPYRLDIELADPVAGWCRLELLPDAGATTVSVTANDVERVRDAWIAALNSLDWQQL